MLRDQIPYADFGIPTGPVSYYIPYLFMREFGDFWHIFQVSQLVQNCLTLAAIIAMLYLNRERKTVLFVSSFISVFLYLIFLTHPWYNNAAATLMIITMALLSSSGLKTAVAAGCAAALCFFSKQDYGILLICGSIVYFASTIRSKGEIKSGLFSIIFFLIGATAVGGLFSIFYGAENILYWLNFGQHDHGSRLKSLVMLTQSPLFYLGCFLFFYGVFKSLRPLMVYGLIITICSITTLTSGLYFTHYSYVAVLPAVMYRFYTDRNLRNHFSLVLILGFMSLISPLKSFVNLSVSTIKKQPEHFLFDSSKFKATENTINLGECNVKLDGLIGPSDICLLTNDIEKLVKRKNGTGNLQILNMTELRHLNGIAGLALPKGHPLWYDEGVVLYPAEKRMIKNQIEKADFDVILLQSVLPSGADIAEYLNVIEKSKNYLRSATSYYSPSNYIDCGLQDNDSCKIILFKKALN